jgi:hypothetical protein
LGLGCGEWGFGSEVWGLGSGFGFEVWGLGSGVWGLGFRVSSSSLLSLEVLEGPFLSLDSEPYKYATCVPTAFSVFSCQRNVCIWIAVL